MSKLFQWLAHPAVNGPRSTLLLRLMAGGVFFWEGILKFVCTSQSVGRFTKTWHSVSPIAHNELSADERPGGWSLDAVLARRVRAAGKPELRLPGAPASGGQRRRLITASNVWS